MPIKKLGQKKCGMNLPMLFMGQVQKIKKIYPDCPESLIDLLKFVDGTYHRKYKDITMCFYFLCSDVYEYPYYILSAKEICKSKDVEYYYDYIDRDYEEVEVDDKIIDNSKNVQWLHFSDCMNNGGTSKLFIDFTPSVKGKKGQIVRFLHDPDEIKVIADSFEEYLQGIIAGGFEFVHEDIIN